MWMTLSLLVLYAPKIKEFSCSWYNTGVKRQDLISILITFLVGVAAGMYLYLTGFAGLVSKLSIPDIEKATEFVIVGDVYGGCREACPSFQVVHDGSYRYLYTPAAGAEQVLRQGVLPISLRRQLEAVITPIELAKQSKEIQPLLCNSYSDGIDVKYEITLDGQLYVLDSCGTAVEAESELWITLGSIWTYYENLGNNS